MYHKSYSRNQRPAPRWRSNTGHRRGGFGNTRNTQSISATQYVNKSITQTVVQPMTITHEFSDFQIDEQLKRNIATRGYTQPTPIQDQAIPHILKGRDVVGVANTGTGKTAAFLIPAINKILNDRSQKVLIIAPTRELAIQIDDEFKGFAHSLQIASLLCIGGVSLNWQLFKLKSNPHVVIATPGRLKDLLMRKVLQLTQFRTIVLDEVDRMVDIGFIKDIQYIIALLPKERQSLFFSATVSGQINQIMQSFLNNPVTVSVKVAETAQGIDQDVIRFKHKDEKIVKLHQLLRQEEFTKVLIFGRTKWNVEKLAKNLKMSGFSAASIHGNKSQNQRLRALSEFKGNQLQVLVATDIAARGLDISDVSHVINFDEPSSYTDYVHRIGRTGRANKQGKALTFVV